MHVIAGVNLGLTNKKKVLVAREETSGAEGCSGVAFTGGWQCMSDGWGNMETNKIIIIILQLLYSSACQQRVAYNRRAMKVYITTRSSGKN
jgi:hypothetical protein